MKFLFSLLTTLILSTQVSAYSVSTHKNITSIAISEYNRCVDLLGPEQTIKKYSKIEEELMINSNLYEDINLAIKARNWHFYNPNKNLGTGTLGLGHASMNERFKYNERLLKDSSGWGKLRYVGALSHYIQDVTNPAHVVPVYHEDDDGFDQFDHSKAWLKVFTKEQCQALFSFKAIQPFEVLDLYARDTLQAIKEPVQIRRNGNIETTSWDNAFWSDLFTSDSKQENFGSYGFLGNAFGKTKLSVGNDSIEVRESAYFNFSQQQVQKAIDATIILLSHWVQ